MIYIRRFVPDITIDGSRGQAAGRRRVGAIVNTPYPLLFADVENDGDIEAIQSAMNGPRRAVFESTVKSLLHLDESVEIVVASEAELDTHAKATQFNTH